MSSQTQSGDIRVIFGLWFTLGPLAALYAVSRGFSASEMQLATVFMMLVMATGIYFLATSQPAMLLLRGLEERINGGDA